MDYYVLKRTICCIFLSLGVVNAAPRKSPVDIPDYTFRETGCRLLIDEINLFTESETSSKQYIELSRYCEDPRKWSKSQDMKGFKLLFIAPDGYIIGICSLENTRLKEREKVVYIEQDNKRIKQIRKYWTYVIGVGVDNLDFEREKCNLVPAGKKGDKPRFPIGVNYPVGLALVYNEKPKVLESVKMSTSGDHYIRTKIDDGMRKRIVKYLQDFYIYGSKTTYQMCEYYQLLYAYPMESGILLRDWYVPNTTDFGLSRCSSNEIAKRNLPFQPKLFKYARPSPSEPNYCTDAFIFSIDNLLPSRQISEDVYLGDLTLPCKSLVEDAEASISYVITSDVNFRTQLSFAISGEVRSDYTPINPGVECNNQAIEETVDVNSNDEFRAENEITASKGPRYTTNVIDQSVFENNLESSVPNIWTDKTCNKFPQDVINTIGSLEGNPINTNDLRNPDLCYWINYIPETKKIVCKLCRALLIQSIIFERPGSQQLNDIMIDGVMDYHFRNKWSNNRNKWLDHNSSLYHALAIQWFTLYDSGLRSNELQDAFENKPGPFFEYIESTRSMMAITKMAVEMGLTFYKFEKLTELVSYLGVDIGHLYSNGNGVRAMIESISDTIHKDLVEYLKLHRPKFSILLDGTSDVSSETIVAILFMIDGLEGRNGIRLYTILDLKEGEKGQKVFDSLLAQLKIDGLESFFKESLVSVTSDGGKNIYNVFNRLVSAYVGRQVLRQWCDNHKENLMYRNTVSQFPMLSNVAVVVNKVHRMYNSKSPKNKAYLRETTVKEGGKPFEVKRSHEIRWVSGNLRAFRTLLENWRFIVKATEGIKNNAEFSKSVRNSALLLLRDLTDATFLSHLAFLSDIGRVIGDMSLQVEKRGATLIAKKHMREQFLLVLDMMKDGTSESVAALLQSASRDGESEDISNDLTLKEFEEKSIKLQGIQLSTSGDNTGFYLFENQNEYLQEFIDQTHFYFPDDVRDGFDIFDPQAFPTVTGDTRIYGAQVIPILNEKLNWGFDNDVLLSDWEKLVVSLVSHKEFSNMKTKTPEEFWSFYMKANVNVGFTSVTREMMTNVLLVSASNAESERILGIYARTKTKSRYLMYPKTVESILRIKINGGSLNDFDKMKYARSFVMKGHSRANDRSRRGKLLPLEDWDELVAENTFDESTGVDETEEEQSLACKT